MLELAPPRPAPLPVRRPAISPTRPTSPRLDVLFALILFLFSIGLYAPGALSPFLFGDDWFEFITHPVSGQLYCPGQAGVFFRPLQPCMAVLEHQLFGFNVTADHVVKLLLASLVPVLLYVFILRLLPG